MGKFRNEYKIFITKRERKKPVRTLPRRRQEVNIRMDLTETEREVDWMHLAQDRNQWLALLNMVINLQVA
jgi:hypothetical protein